MNIGQLSVMLRADASGIKSGVQEASTALDGLGGAAKKLGGVLAGAFAAQKVIGFGVDSIRTFAEAEAVWSSLASTVDASGTSFEAVQGQIQGAAAAMQAATTVGDEDFARALQRLTTHTGDVQRGLGAMGLAADLAAAKQIDVADAADLIGRAMAGNTAQLTRLFPALKGSTDLFGDLQRVLGDAAENQAKTFSGRMEQIGNNFGDLKESIGGALVGMGDFDNVMLRVRDGLKAVEGWVVANADALRALGGAMVDVGVRAAPHIGRFFQDLKREVEAVYWWVDKLQTALRGLGMIGHGIKGPGLDTQDILGAGKHASLILRHTDTTVKQATTSIITSTGAITKGIKSSTQAVKTWFDEMRAELARPITPQNRLDQSGLAGAVPTLPTINLRPFNAFGIELGLIATKMGVLNPAMERMSYAMNLAGQGIREAGLWAISGLNQFASILVAQTRKGLDAKVGFEAALKGGLVMAAAMEVINAALVPLAPVLNALLIPLRLVGTLIGTALAKPLQLLARALGFLIRGIGTLLNKLPGSIGDPLVKAGQEMIDASHTMREAGKEAGAAGAAFQAVASALTNVPAMLQVDRLRAAATGPAGGAGIPNLPEGATIGHVENNYTIVVPAAPGMSVGEWVDAVGRELKLRQGRFGGDARFLANAWPA